MLSGKAKSKVGASLDFAKTFFRNAALRARPSSASRPSEGDPRGERGSSAAGMRGAKIFLVDAKKNFRELCKKPVFLIGAASALFALVVIVALAIIVAAEPKASPGISLSVEGAALVGQWMLPPGEISEPRMYMELDGERSYTIESAVKMGGAPGSIDGRALSRRNDAWAERLFGTVP